MYFLFSRKSATHSVCHRYFFSLSISSLETPLSIIFCIVIYQVLCHLLGSHRYCICNRQHRVCGATYVHKQSVFVLCLALVGTFLLFFCLYYPYRMFVINNWITSSGWSCRHLPFGFGSCIIFSSLSTTTACSDSSKVFDVFFGIFIFTVSI